MDNPENSTARNCVFCQNSISNKSFCTSKNFFAVYNLAPIVPGHSLIVPKKHYVSILELSDIELNEMVIFAREVTQLLLSFFECKDFDWTIQDGVFAGQTIPHIHMHLIPRKPNDLQKGNEWYQMIPESEKLLIDSSNRTHLTDIEYDQVTERLLQANINRKK